MPQYVPSAAETAQQIAKGKISAREAVSASIARIEATQASINAVVVPRFDDAVAEADAADKAQRRSEARGPLHGVPVTVKECFDLVGTASTLGLTSRAGHRPTKDSPLVSRLRNAGAVIVGKTNVSQLLLPTPCANPVYGQTNNPWKLDRSPGASSGGKGAVLAVGGSALGLGSDIGGSVRLPADACGVNALKPTAARLTMEGHAPLYARQEAIMCQPGPMARCVADLALAMRVLVGHEKSSLDPVIAPAPWRDPSAVSLDELRIAFHTSNGIVIPSPAIRRTVVEAARALELRGLIVEEWLPPHLVEMWQLYCKLMFADGFARMRGAARGSEWTRHTRRLLSLGLLPKSAFSITPWLLRFVGQNQLAEGARYARPVSVEQCRGLVARRATLRRRFLAALDANRIDAIVCPTFALPALPHTHSILLGEAVSYTAVYNLLGMPAGVVAASRIQTGEESDRVPGRSWIERAARSIEGGSAGLPTSVQVVTRHWREDVALKVMGALEEHFRTSADYPANPPI